MNVHSLQVRRSILAMFSLLDVRLPFRLGIPSGRANKSSSEDNSSDNCQTQQGKISVTTSSGRAIPMDLRAEAKVNGTHTGQRVELPNHKLTSQLSTASASKVAVELRKVNFHPERRRAATTKRDRDRHDE